ncbi:DNA polymerase III subunit gamma/tau [Luteolibacter flavescens]|uniref:DNA polymerase III subunit gamma/tau n=1 Tax=Luteolibacter flavescens TaxID=1859460 RepID=A0ABT3FTQ6_9BACT|nr:DNA polymerase III subunit gamma/tau [Luteolibacter flavescens]MCW1886966.1 DNA polymerase III subunit gamma/tau [Luteolibacter flavescens]
MSYQVFARKYRPKTFDDVLGQDHVVRTLKNAIAQKRLAHAYLFVGPRGTGKTTTARILAKALNCTGGPKADFDPDEEACVEIAEGRSLDVLEIDGASNNSVDDVRNIRESVRFAPARGQFKIYYIDEVHMLSTAAFNALLKTLEEPPEHVKFIFATTEAHKVLPTILSRCQRFDLRPIPTEIIASHLLHIAKEEGVNLHETAAWAIGKGADGGMRDAQSMLDQLVAFCGDTITEANVLDIFGFTSRETVASVIGSILARDTPAALTTVQRESEAGRELSQLLGELIGCMRALLVSKLDSSAGGDGIPTETWEALKAAAEAYPPERLLSVIDVFAETEGRMKWASNKRLHLEIGMIKAVQTLGEVRLSDVIRVLAGATDQLTSPVTIAPTATAPAPATAAPAPVVEATPAPISIAEPEAKAEEVTPPAPVEVEPEPPAPATAPQLLQEEPPQPAAKPEKASSLDDLIAMADEGSAFDLTPEPVESEPPPWKPEPDAPPEPAAPKVDPMEEFYKDPLIQTALEMFAATIKK